MFHSVEWSAYIEAYSASDAQVQRVPMKQRMKPYTRATGPPFVSAVTKTTVKASLLRFSSWFSSASFQTDASYQVAMTVVVRPRILMNPKFRWPKCQHSGLCTSVSQGPDLEEDEAAF